jgi:hypothetical protein
VVPEHMNKLFPYKKENLWVGSQMKKNPCRRAWKRDEEEAVQRQWPQKQLCILNQQRERKQ